MASSTTITMNFSSFSKKQERVERKKRKSAALENLQVTERMENDTKIAEDFRKEYEDDFKKVTYKKNHRYSYRKGSTPERVMGNGQPDLKRVKLSLQEAIVGYPDKNLDTNGSDVTGSDCTDAVSENQSVQEDGVNEQGVRDTALHLRDCGTRASLEIPQDERTPIFLTDIQHLLMSALIGKKSPWSPDRWCSLKNSTNLSHSVVVILEGLSLYHYLSNESHFKETNAIFQTRLEVVLPPCKKGMIIEEIAKVPMTNAQTQQLIEQYGCLESAIEMIKDPTLLVKSIFPIESEHIIDNTTELPPDDKFPRTKLLLSALQMVDEGYPVPLRGELHKRFNSYVFTKSKYATVNNDSPMYGVDCEMCRTAIGCNELTRISIVNERLEIVYETLVLPSNQIIDYLTPYSGITPELMKTVTKTLKDVQKEVQDLLPSDAILVGQSLNFDLNAMKMMHPYVIDTSICFNLSGFRKRKAKLQTLAKKFLKESIQENKDGHDSVEDSLASLKLVKMKLANSVEFGDEILMQKKRKQEILREATNSDSIKNNLFACASQRDKATAIVSSGLLQDQVKDIIKKAEEAVADLSLKAVSLYEMNTNKEAVKTSRQIVLENSLTITNLHLEEEQIQLENVTKTIIKLDKWIGKLWNSIGHNGMFIVLFGGASECPSGLAKIAIKKDAANVVENIQSDPIAV